MAEDIWGRLFVLIGMGAMIWSQFAHDAMWIGGAVAIMVGLMVIPSRKEDGRG